MRPRDHNRLAWIFAICSIGTLVIINAILSFMLTPGAWKPFDAGAMVYKGVLNPSYLPTTIGGILIALALAGAAGVLLALAAARDTVRRAVLSPGFDLSAGAGASAITRRGRG